MRSTPAPAAAPGDDSHSEVARLVASAILALALHTAVLFGVDARSPESAFGSDTAVEVTLVAPAPPPATPETRPPQLALPPSASAHPPPVAPAVPERRHEAPVPEETTAPEAVAAPSISDALPAPDAELAPTAAPSPPTGLGASGPSRGRVDAKPRYRSNPEPRYPALARQRRQQGVVLLVVRVSASGAPERVQIKAGSGYPALDTAAVEAVERWRFDPALEDGEPVAADVEVPIRFELY